MGNSHVTVLEIDLKAIEHNLNHFKSKLLPETKVLAVVKAFGYGSSSVEIAKFLEPKISYFAVAYFDEGLALREAGVKTPILVLHPQKLNLGQIIKFNLEPNVYSITLLKAFIEEAKNLNIQNYPVHLKFNTGLNRLGFSKKDIPEILSLVKNQQEIVVASVFSHIAASEDLSEKAFTLKQINTFKEISNQLIPQLSNKPFRHMLNTSGIVNYASQAQFELVRLGIGLYGFANDEAETAKLQNVITLKSLISQIQTVEKGETVGYNRAFKAAETVKTATIPIGHADGISRQFGNGVGYVYINNQKAPIVGNVCMDMLMVNVTNIDCQEGDEVLVFKNQMHIEDLAKRTNTIPYEMLTAISQRVKRAVK